MYYKNADLKLKIMLLFATGAARSKRKIPRVGLHLYPIFIFSLPCARGGGGCAAGGVEKGDGNPSPFFRTITFTGQYDTPIALRHAVLSAHQIRRSRFLSAWELPLRPV